MNIITPLQEGSLQWEMKWNGSTPEYMCSPNENDSHVGARMQAARNSDTLLRISIFKILISCEEEKCYLSWCVWLDNVVGQGFVFVQYIKYVRGRIEGNLRYDATPSNLKNRSCCRSEISCRFVQYLCRLFCWCTFRDSHFQVSDLIQIAQGGPA